MREALVTSRRQAGQWDSGAWLGPSPSKCFIAIRTVRLSNALGYDSDLWTRGSPRAAAAADPLRLAVPHNGVGGLPSGRGPGALGLRPGSRARPAAGGRAHQVAQTPDEEAGCEAAPSQTQPAAPLRVLGDTGQGHLWEGEEGTRELGTPGECPSQRPVPGSSLAVSFAELPDARILDVSVGGFQR